MPVRRRVTRPRRYTRRVGIKRSIRARRPVGVRVKRSRAPIATGVTMSKAGRTGYRMRQVSASKMQIVGRSYLGSVDNKDLYHTNDCILGVWDVNPSLLGDRIAVISTTFEKYVFKKIRFTYVPQTGTLTKGSVGLVYERDPSAHLACPDGSHYLAQVMSYENAVLTPAWKGASNSIYRNKSERELYWIGGPQGQNDPRHFSQGLFVAYGSGLDTGSQQSLGYIVMDYVLELDTPTVIPAMSGVNNVVANAPSQYLRVPGALPVGGTQWSIIGKAMKKVRLSTGSSGVAGSQKVMYRDFEIGDTGPLKEFMSQPGTIIEVILERCAQALTGTPPAMLPAADDLTLHSLVGAGTAGGSLTTPKTFVRGQRIYLVVQTLIGGGTLDNSIATSHTVVNIYSSLTAAWSASGDAPEHCNQNRDDQTAHGDTAGAGLFYLASLDHNVAPSTVEKYVSISGYLRVINRGVATIYSGKTA